MADGVSSWQRYGVNPALFAWELMVRCEEAAIKHAGKLEVGLSEMLEVGVHISLSFHIPGLVDISSNILQCGSPKIANLVYNSNN